MTEPVTDTITLNAIGPGPSYEKIAVWLPLLFLESQRSGVGKIEGLTFTECLIEGPAVLVPLSGCEFDDCNLGDADGDPRNLTLLPNGSQKVAGVIQIHACKFIRCQFLGVGFTGSKPFLDQLVQAVGGSVQ